METLKLEQTLDGISHGVAEKAYVVIKRCSNKGNIVGGARAGGCFGIIEKNGNISIENFDNSGNMKAQKFFSAGCIAEVKTDTMVKVTNTRNTGKIESVSNVGGILGYTGVGSTIIVNSTYNSGEIISEEIDAGGIIGDTDSINYLINVYNIGNCKTLKNTGSDVVNGSCGGLVGSSYNMNAQLHIINAYNIGDMQGMKCTSGIIGGKKNNLDKSEIRNVYTAGQLTGDNNNGIICLPQITELSQNNVIENAYYRDNVENGTNLKTDNTTKVTSQQINSQEFVDSLNQYVESKSLYKINENINVKLLKWKLGEQGYPIFE